MKQVFLENLDFIYLFYGAAFFFLGTACLILFFREKSKNNLPWLILSLFGFLHGLNEWFDMLALSFMEPGFLGPIRNVILASSFLCLLEFFRRSLFVLKKIRISIWFYSLLLPLLLSDYFIMNCSGCFNSSIRFFIGFPASIGVFFILWVYGRERNAKASCPFLLYSAYAFILYAVLSGLVVPKSHFFLSHLLNDYIFFDVLHMPVQFIRGIVATFIAFFFLCETAQFSDFANRVEKRPQPMRNILVSFFVLYVAFLFVGFRFISILSRHEHAYLNKIIRADAKLLKNALGEADFDIFAYPKKNILYYIEFRQLHSRLLKLADISTFSKNLYIVTFKDGKPQFAVGSKMQIFPYSFVPAFGGDIPTNYISDAFHSNQTTISKEYQDSEGYRTFSIFVPLHNSNKEVVALLGIDLNGRRLNAEVARIRLYAIFVIMALILLLISGYAFLIIFALRSIELEIQRRNLNDALVRLEETRGQLSRSEETFRGILNNSPNPIFGFDRDLRLIFWNHGAEDIYGYKKEEVINDKNPLLNKKITDLLGISDIEVKLGDIFSGVTLQFEAKNKTFGGVIEVAMTVFPVKDSIGNILFGVGLAQDISKHKRYEEELATAHAKLEAVLDAATKFSIISTDLKGVIKVFNTGAERMFGVDSRAVVDKQATMQFHLDSEFIICKKDSEMTCNESVKSLEEIAAEVCKNGICEREWTGVRMDGTRFPVLLTISSLNNLNGEITGYLCIGIDLTQRKLTEKAFVESQQKYKDLVENLNVAVYSSTPGPEGRFLEVNPALINMFEAESMQQLLDCDIASIYQDPADRKQYSDKVSDYGYVKNEELRLKTLKGRPFWASVTAVKKQNDKGEVYFYGIIQDITERRLMEARIFEEKDRLQKIAASLGAGISLVNNKLEIVWVNETLERWFGKFDSLEGAKCYKTYLSSNSVCDNCPSVKTLRTGQIYSSERRIHFPDGRIMDFLIISSPIKNEKGELEQVLELMLDITERKRITELLEYERALSKNVIDSIDEDLMILACQKRVVLDVNKHFLERWNLKKEDVVGKSCQDFNFHFCPPCEECNADEVVKYGSSISGTHVHKMSDGTSIYADVTLFPLKDEKGNTIGIIHLSKDVTERKRLEEELRHYSESLESLVKDRTKALQKSELMFRKLFESAQDGILIVDFKDGEILDANPYMLNLLECTRDEVQGVDYKRLPFLLESNIFEQVHNELKEKVLVYFDEAILKTAQGRDLAVEVRASLYFVENRKIIQFNIRDLTERKKLEKIKTEFVSMVSHELRTPLSAIKEGVEIVADGTQGKLNKSQAECLGIALSNIRRLNRLIGDILDISKIQSNILKVNFAPCDVYELVETVYDLIKIEVEKRGMLFVTDMEKNLPLIYADKDRLVQVLINLLNNAVKFTREHSKIILFCKRYGDFVEFGVKDEGAGITPDELSKLFGKFVQLDSTLVRRVGGTGLGLYISRNLVEAMGGKIWADSKPGSGSVFSFNIPVYKVS